MTVNSLSPAFVKLNYSRTGFSHTATYPVAPDGALTPGDNPQMAIKSGFSIDFVSAMEDYSNLLKPIFTAEFTINTAEFWSQPTPSDDPVWIYTHSLGDAGTNPADLTPASEAVMTARTDNGGLIRLYYLEVPIPVNLAYFSTFPSDYADIADFFLSSDSWLRGRDNGFPLTFISLKTKTNDVLLRKIRG